MHVWNVLHAARWKHRTQKLRKHRHLRTIAQISPTISSQLRHVSTNRKKCFLLHMSSQYGELRPIDGWDWLASLGHPSKFQRISRRCFVTAPTLLTRSQPNFAPCSAVTWAGKLYIHFGELFPLTEFYHVQNVLCVQVLRYPTLAALLLSTRAVSLIQTLRNFRS